MALTRCAFQRCPYPPPLSSPYSSNNQQPAYRNTWHNLPPINYEENKEVSEKVYPCKRTGSISQWNQTIFPAKTAPSVLTSHPLFLSLLALIYLLWFLVTLKGATSRGLGGGRTFWGGLSWIHLDCFQCISSLRQLPKAQLDWCKSGYLCVCGKWGCKVVCPLAPKSREPEHCYYWLIPWTEKRPQRRGRAIAKEPHHPAFSESPYTSHCRNDDTSSLEGRLDLSFPAGVRLHEENPVYFTPGLSAPVGELFSVSFPLTSLEPL